MRVYGEDILESKVVEKILRTMPMKFDHVVTTIIESHDTDIMTVAELQGSIESHVSRIMEKTEKGNEEALKSQVNFTNIAEPSRSEDIRGREGRGGHNVRSTNRGRGKCSFTNQERKNFNCYHCGKFGHKAADCRYKQQENIAENQYKHTGESSDNPQTLLLVANNFSGDGDIWYLDTGCSNHMCGKKELFFSLDETVKSTVKFENNSNIPILGKGRVAIRLKDGSQNFISDVFYAPGLHHNLLSMGQLSEKGYNMQIHDGYCMLIDKNRRFIAKVKMTPNRLFPLNVQHDKIPCLSSIIQNDDWLWHMRFGHYHFSGLNFLSRKEYVSGLPVINIPEGICETCEIGKKHRESFPTGKSWRARKPLEIVHSDLCMVEIPSHGGSRYFITFIDDFSRKAWVYLLKQKSEACDAFKSFKAFVEKQSDYKIKALRTDRGQEYLACEDFFDHHGIQHQMTTRYTPQQNGVAKRKNRTIMDMVRCMLKAKQMPREFWAEAVSTAVYILYRCPTKSVCDKTPEEAWSGRKPSIRHLRIFGCIAYAHVPDQLRKKLDDKGEKCIFIGYNTNSKAYKLYNPVDNKSAIALCRNPVFHGRSKHINIRFHKIRELVAEKEVAIKYCPTEEQVADIFTKPLKAELFYKLKRMLGMIQA
uniref:Retrovirus-related Pol polyprotein from transposon TNT 1-94 n=1 Tax=Cajanus cajan TaxID=3821 RepID=A0A151RUV3_CAJCA|nr:Retrovirus-related Pol polyprotein from transposon TNT 1-94 [Cajanus cajan]